MTVTGGGIEISCLGVPPVLPPHILLYSPSKERFSTSRRFYSSAHQTRKRESILLPRGLPLMLGLLCWGWVFSSVCTWYQSGEQGQKTVSIIQQMAEPVI